MPKCRSQVQVRLPQRGCQALPQVRHLHVATASENLEVSPRLPAARAEPLKCGTLCIRSHRASRRIRLPHCHRRSSGDNRNNAEKLAPPNREFGASSFATRTEFKCAIALNRFKVRVRWCFTMNGLGVAAPSYVWRRLGGSAYRLDGIHGTISTSPPQLGVLLVCLAELRENCEAQSSFIRLAC